MPEYDFNLILDRDPEPLIDDLFEAGCGDALFGVSDHVPYADFTREADSLPEALESAVNAVQSVGLVVLRVEPDDLVTTAEIAARLGRSQQSVHQLITGARGPGGFPPCALAASSPGVKGRAKFWRWVDVARWAELDREVLEAASAIATLNAALELNHRAHELPTRTAEMLAGVALGTGGVLPARDEVA